MLEGVCRFSYRNAVGTEGPSSGIGRRTSWVVRGKVKDTPTVLGEPGQDRSLRLPKTISLSGQIRDETDFRGPRTHRSSRVGQTW